MNEYRKDIMDVWYYIGIIKENIKRIEAKLQNDLIEDTVIEYQYGSTPARNEPSTAVPSTQATSGSTHEPIRSLNNPPPECFAPSTQACKGE